MSPSSSPSSDSEIATEENLMTRVGRGEVEALHELYQRYRRPLFSVAIRMVNDFGAAEELLQDSFVKIWRSAASYDSRKSRPFTWAVTILRRGCIDHLRRQPARTPEPTDPEAESATGDPVRAHVLAHEVSRDVESALRHLPVGPKAALELALFSGLTHGEIASQMEQPLGTVKAWIRRGLLAVRSELQHLT